MKQIRISDVTMKQTGSEISLSLRVTNPKFCGIIKKV